ncbi:MAG: O-antigen ligase family protein [Candidatus Kerfeldbacteria bacterium]|nr:O-antigen ligase family protein [Candidatus Kerfeldbacteria bacterium]
MMGLALVPFAIALWRPTIALGLLAAVLPMYLIRFSVGAIPTTLLELGLYAATLGIIARLLHERKLRAIIVQGWRAFGSYRWPMIVLLGSGLLSAVLSSDVRAGLGAWKAWYFDAALFGFLVVLYRRHVWPWLIGGLASGSSVISLWGVWEYVARHAQLQDGRLNSVFGTPNYHALLTVPIIVLLLGLAFRERRPRLWLVAAVAANLLALYFTFSYGGYVALASGVAVLGLFSRVYRKYVVIIAALVVVVGFLQIGTDKFRRLGDFTGRSSAHVRVQIWQASWRIIREHPLVGIGPGNFEPAYREAIPHIVFPPLEWLVALPHSFPLAVASQTGLVGVAAFVWLLAAFFRAARQRRDWLGATLTAAMVALLVHGLVDTPYFKNDLALLFFALLSLSLIEAHLKQASPDYF